MNFFAQRVFGSRPWLDPMLRQQAELSGGDLEELNDIVSEAILQQNILIGVVIPAPVRGYAILVGTAPQYADDGTEESHAVVCEAHVLDGQPMEAYMALFSSITFHMLDSGPHQKSPEILIDRERADSNMIEAVKLLGDVYKTGLTPPREEIEYRGEKEPEEEEKPKPAPKRKRKIKAKPEPEIGVSAEDSTESVT